MYSIYMHNLIYQNSLTISVPSCSSMDTTLSLCSEEKTVKFFKLLDCALS